MPEARLESATSGRPFASDQTHVQTIGPLLRQLHALGYAPEDLARARRAYDLAVELWAVNFQSSGRPFLCHAVGTASLVARHGGPKDAVRAALLHAAYGTGDFGVRIGGATRRRRARVAAAAGPGAEALVHRFHELLRDFGTHWDRVLEDRRVEDLPEVDRTVLFMRVCNDLDDVTDHPFSSSSRQARLAAFVSGSVALAEALGEDALAAQLREALALRQAERVLPDALRERHPSGYIVVPRAFAKRLLPGALELLHRVLTTGRLRP